MHSSTGIFARVLIFLLLTSCASASTDPFEREVYAMGTMLRIVLYEPDREKAMVQSEALIRIVEETEQQLSNWREDSELSRLNRQPVGTPFTASASFATLLQELNRWVERTNQAFDPAIGRLIIAENEPATGSQIQAALSECGMRHLRMKSGQIIREADVLLDAGAFGKGEALDRALARAQELQMEPLMLDFGGQIAVRGVSPSKEAWDILMADPENRQQTLGANLRLRSGSLSTSGVSERPSHILDPRTGRPSAAFGSVTVWSERALVSDILSTALFVMGPESGYQWAQENNIAACFLVLSGDGLRRKTTAKWDSIQ